MMKWKNLLTAIAVLTVVVAFTIVKEAPPVVKTQEIHSRVNPIALPSPASSADSLPSIPLAFEKNMGQADEDTHYLLRTSGFLLSLKNAGPEFVLYKEGAPPAKIKMVLEETGALAKPVGDSPLAFRVSDFRGNDPDRWTTDIPNVSRVTYPNVYPGIDLVFYADQRKLEHDFIVHPGADPSQVKFHMEGAESAEIDAQGNLNILRGEQSFQLRKPFLYQEIKNSRQEVAGGFVLAQNSSVTFHTDAYDNTRPLVIDPVITYATFFAGAPNDGILDIKVDSDGNVYIAGTTDGTSGFPAGGTTLQSGTNGNIDIIVAKFDQSGNVIFKVFLGGSTTDFFPFIALDSSRNVFVGGTTRSLDFPIVNAFQSTHSAQAVGGTFDNFFITKINPTGSALLYSTFLSGTANTHMYDLIVDPSGNAYVSGEAQGFGGNSGNGNGYPKVNALFPSLGNGGGGVISKLSADGSSLLFSTYISDKDEDRTIPHAISLDLSGNLYIGGQTTATNIPTTNPYQATNNGNMDAFVMKLNSSGSSLLYGTYLGGSSQDQVFEMVVDASENIYVTGTTLSANFPTVNAQSAIRTGGFDTDCFVTKINSSGTSLDYSTYFPRDGGGHLSCSRGLELDSSFNLIIGGSGPAKQVDPLSVTPLGGTASSFIAKLSPDGSQTLFSSHLHIDMMDSTVDANDDIWLGGRIHTFTMPLAGNPVQNVGFIGTDGVVVKVGPTPPEPAEPVASPGVGISSPFFQVGDGFYTFVGVSHPSFSGLAPEVGLKVTAVLTDGQVLASKTYTVDAGQTKRLFMVNMNHSFVNPTALPDAEFILIPANSLGVASPGFIGSLQFDPVSSDPTQDIRALSMWGAVNVEDTGTGFAMEFIGDLNDSSAHPGMTAGLFPSGVN